MVNTFTVYMDHVKAEDVLKRETETFVRERLPDAAGRQEISGSGIKARKRKPVAKRFWAGVCAAAACMALTVVGYAYYRTPVNYVCMDINPSVEIGVNAFGRVVSVHAYNEDGLKVLGKNKFFNLSVKDTVAALVQGAAEEGFLDEDGASVIALTAESENDETAAELQESSEEGAQEALDEAETPAVIYTGCSDLALREEARELGISPGKLKLIQLLQTLDPSITVEEYKDAKVRNIFARGNELLEASGSDFHQFGEYIGSMEGTHDEEQEEEETSEQEESETSEESESEDSASKEEKEKEKEKNKNQESESSEAQNENQNSAAQQKDEKQNSKAESKQAKDQEKEKENKGNGSSSDEEEEDEEEDEETDEEETGSASDKQSEKGKNGK